ncbi:hypothetical protein R1sor_024318 [Riccia sorocarpa]|uniref:Uncharacterized protein n=1 Tax=Riccia sorocarpa TaxID=122646 RepID=A0ABD3GQ71_9MARC
MAAVGPTLADVQTSVLSSEPRSFVRIGVHVVSFDAPLSWPSRFTYHACGMPLPDGRFCLKSVERRLTCPDGHLWNEHRPVFRFQLRLSDGSMRGRTLKATVFNSVTVMLKRSPADFRALSYHLQDRVVVDACRDEPVFFANIRTYNGRSVVEQLFNIDIADTVVEPVAVAVVEPQPGLADCSRNARNITKFEPHMREHGFRGVDHVANEKVLAELKNRGRRRPTTKRKTQTLPTARDFIQLRSSVNAAWKRTVKRKYERFVAEAESSALFRFGPEPKAPEETAFTVLIDALLLLDRKTDAGFWAERWNFELQECVLKACHKTLTVNAWCQSIENKLRLELQEWPTPELSPKIRASVTALKGIFPQILPSESDAVRTFMWPLRSALIQSGVEHLESLKLTLDWIRNCSLERIHERAKKQHQQWVQHSKHPVLEKL